MYWAFAVHAKRGTYHSRVVADKAHARVRSEKEGAADWRGRGGSGIGASQEGADLNSEPSTQVKADDKVKAAPEAKGLPSLEVKKKAKA